MFGSPVEFVRVYKVDLIIVVSKEDADASNPHCAIKLYEKCSYHASDNSMDRPIKSTSILKYSSQTVGINTLGTYMKRMLLLQILITTDET